MCGIFYIITKSKLEKLHPQKLNGLFEKFATLKARGPDRGRTVRDTRFHEQFFGFQRLAINDISSRSDQPFYLNAITAMCNGEIYNYKSLIDKYELEVNSHCDCKVILPLYQIVGIEQMLNELDGVFAGVLVDSTNITQDKKIYVFRDALGVRPIFMRYDDHTLAVASEAKALENLDIAGDTKQLSAGHYLTYENNIITIKSWSNILTTPTNYLIPKIDVATSLFQKLKNATLKRIMTDRPFGCLLSGGMDSSAITALLAQELAQKGEKLKTFAIGFTATSTDIIAAQKVANFLNTDHTSIIIPIEDAIQVIPEVVEYIESYDITTVRASVGMYLLSKWIKEHTDIVVLFSGEGSDELFAGYLYFHLAPSNKDLEEECKRRVRELPYYDVLRADRCIAAHGLELRVPFLDKEVVKFALSLPGEIRKPQNGFEKFFLRKAFETLLPESIIWRRKEGFSDGVSNNKKAWYEYIQDAVIEENGKTSLEKESNYYKKLFFQKFKNLPNPIPGMWLPRWQNTNDPSGRLINF